MTDGSVPRDRVAPACEDARRDLSLLLDGDLGPARSLLLRRHLAGCPACRLELGSYRDIRVRLHALAPDSPGAERLEDLIPGGAEQLHRSILDRVATDSDEVAVDSDPALVPARDSGPGLGWIMPRVAAAMVLFTAGILLGRGGEADPSSDPYPNGIATSTSERPTSQWGGRMGSNRLRTEPVSFEFEFPEENHDGLRLLLDLTEADRTYEPYFTRPAVLRRESR